MKLRDAIEMWDMANDEVEQFCLGRLNQRDECDFDDNGICRECGEEEEES